MKFVLECDGVLFDVQPAYRAAYDAACKELGLPRSDPAALWRTVRRGGPDGELVRGAKPGKLREFRRRFDELLESDEALARLEPHAGVAAALAQLSRAGQCHLVSTGRNRAARQMHLDGHDLAIHFVRMMALSAERGARTTQLGELAEGDPRTVIVAASDGLVRSAEAAGLFAAGVTSGACTINRLRLAGAQAVFGDLAELAQDLSTGSKTLIAAGLLPKG